MMGYDNKLLRSFTDMAKANPKRVVFAEANHGNMLKAAAEAKAEGICIPILLGNEERLQRSQPKKISASKGSKSSTFVTTARQNAAIVMPRSCLRRKPAKVSRMRKPAKKMVDRNAFGMMMVATGDADAFVTGVYSRYSK
ncbi:MAG: phosphate acyltransferase [Parabacteroides merdae]